MAMTQTQPESEHIMHISLGWILLGTVVVFLLGLAGGIVAQQLFQPPLPPLTGSNTDRLLPTVQQVTISPSKATVELLAGVERSVVTLARGTSADYTIIATGSVVTNDGVIVTTATETAHLALDYEGRSVSLEYLGRDALYGFSYYRAHDTVTVPLDVRADDPGVGQQLLATARERATFAPRVRPFQVFEFTLPQTGDPAAAQRIVHGPSVDDPLLTGSPLLDEEGKIAGIIADASAGRAYSATHLKQSMERLANNQREVNPLADVGLGISYSFIRRQPDQPLQFAVTISGIAPDSPAALSALRVGDVITAVNATALTWQGSVVQQLAAPLPLPLTVLREGREQQIQLQPVTLVQE